MKQQDIQHVGISHVKDLHEAGEPVQLIDVRSPAEYAAGHVPGAINIPMDQIEGRLADVDVRRPLVLVCQSGKRAAMTAELLKPLGHDLLVLQGGTAAWSQAGHPVVGSQSTRWSLERQVRFGAGLIVLSSVILGLTVNPLWFGLTAFAGAGLTFAGLTNFCLMGSVLAKMPWNQAKASAQPAATATPCTAKDKLQTQTNQS